MAGKPLGEGLPSYLGRLTQAPLLTPEEERRLTMLVREGCRDSRQKLAESNMRLVINIARTYHSRAMPLEDLIQEGSIGLMQAIERFDPDKGFRFSTYATHWIRQAIGRAIDNKGKTIRLPAHISQTARKLERARQDWLRNHGVEPSNEELCRLVGLTPGKLQILKAAHQELLSLEVRLGENESTTLGSVIRDTERPSAEEALIHSEILQELEAILSALDEREVRILALRLRGLSAKVDRDQAAASMNLSKERYRAIEAQAVKKLRAMAQARRLRELLER